MIAASMLLMGFDFSNPRIPVDEIENGGPPKDGIPALTRPVFVPAIGADYLQPGDRVIGVEIGNLARAYPIRIMNWHEIVNDRLGDTDIVVTYCPLCGTGMVFDAVVGGKKLEFGVSGKLYNSDVLLYDRETESLWSQVKMEAVTGKLSGSRLTLIPSRLTSWADWKTRHPNTTALSIQTGHRRDYSRDPYIGYDRNRTLFFPVSHRDERLHPKEWVIGFTTAGVSRAYPFSVLTLSDGRVVDTVGNRTIVVEYDRRHRTAVVLDPDGRPLPSMTAYWFAWAAFHPKTSIYTIRTDIPSKEAR